MTMKIEKQDDGVFVTYVQNGRRIRQDLKTFIDKTNRCSVCHAIIPQDREMCSVCESYYPCNGCPNSARDSCMCIKWKTWFSLQWECLTLQYDTKNSEKCKNPPEIDGEIAK